MTAPAEKVTGAAWLIRAQARRRRMVLSCLRARKAAAVTSGDVRAYLKPIPVWGASCP